MKAFDDARKIYNYLFGENGVKIDYSKAFEECCRQAHNGNAFAVSYLGLCYEKGFGVAKDCTKAHELYRESFHELMPLANNGDIDAQRFIGHYFTHEKMHSLAATWYKILAERGDIRAQYKLALCYRKGNGVEQSYTEAFKLFKSVAEQGYAPAQFSLALCYKNGKGVEPSHTEAFKWSKSAAEQGYPKAQGMLGLCYFDGIGVEKSITEAVKWIKMAAEKGDSKAQYNLGICYYNGYGVEKSTIEAIKWMKLSAEQGDKGAPLALEMMNKK